MHRPQPADGFPCRSRWSEDFAFSDKGIERKESACGNIRGVLDIEFKSFRNSVTTKNKERDFEYMGFF